METVLEDLLRAAAKQPSHDHDTEWVRTRGRHLRRRRVGVTVLAAALTVVVLAGAPVLLSSSDETEVAVMGGPSSSGFDGRVPIAGNDGTAGYADREAVDAKPVIRPGATQAEIDVAISVWEHTPIPVTATRDPNSTVVGYFVHTIGFIDLATFNSSAFDLDAVLAARKAETEKTDRALMAGEWLPGGA